MDETTTTLKAGALPAGGVHALIPHQGGGSPTTGEHWLVRQLHVEREQADAARRSALMGLTPARA